MGLRAVGGGMSAVVGRAAVELGASGDSASSSSDGSLVDVVLDRRTSSSVKYSPWPAFP